MLGSAHARMDAASPIGPKFAPTKEMGSPPCPTAHGTHVHAHSPTHTNTHTQQRTSVGQSRAPCPPTLNMFGGEYAKPVWNGADEPPATVTVKEKLPPTPGRTMQDSDAPCDTSTQSVDVYE